MREMFEFNRDEASTERSQDDIVFVSVETCDTEFRCSSRPQEENV